MGGGRSSPVAGAHHARGTSCSCACSSFPLCMPCTCCNESIILPTVVSVGVAACLGAVRVRIGACAPPAPQSCAIAARTRHRTPPRMAAAAAALGSACSCAAECTHLHRTCTVTVTWSGCTSTSTDKVSTWLPSWTRSTMADGSSSRQCCSLASFFCRSGCIRVNGAWQWWACRVSRTCCANGGIGVLAGVAWLGEHARASSCSSSTQGGARGARAASSCTCASPERAFMRSEGGSASPSCHMAHV